MYNFDGKHKHRPAISLGGASKQEQRNALLQRNMSERTARQESRKRMAAAIKIQSVFRGWIVRRREMALLRQEFDEELAVVTKDRRSFADSLPIMLKKIIIFYEPALDWQRLVSLCQMILRLHSAKSLFITGGVSQWIYIIKGLLLMCCRTIELAASTELPIAMPLRILEVFTDSKSYAFLSDEHADYHAKVVLAYVVDHGYFKCLKVLLERKVPSCLELSSKAPTQLALTTKDLMLRPINFVCAEKDNDVTSVGTRHAVLGIFADEILSRQMPVQISHFLVPSIADELPLLPFVSSLLNALETDIITNRGFQNPPTSLSTKRTVNGSQWLLYAVLSVAEKQMTTLKCTDLLNYSHLLRQLLPFLQKPRAWSGSHQNTDDSDSDSDHDESMDTTELEDQEGNFIREHCLEIFDSRRHVDGLLAALEHENFQSVSGKSYLKSLYHMAHFMIGEQKCQIHRTRFLYRLAFKNTFLRNVWMLLRNETTSTTTSKEVSLLHFLSRGSTLSPAEKEGIVPPLNVFTILLRHALFCIYDTDFYSTNAGSPKSLMPFSIEEVIEMSTFLKEVVTGLIELMYSDTRPLVIQSYGKAIRSMNARRNFGVSQVTSYNALCVNTTSLLKQLYSRDCRHSFCPKDSWLSQRIGINAEQVDIDEFFEQRNEDDGQFKPGMSAVTARNLAVLQLIPFTVPFMQRIVVFQRIIAKDRRHSQGDNPFVSQSSFLNISVNRKYLYQDAYDQLSQEREADIKRIVKVQMINAQGLDEAGIDGGGIFREFMDQLLKTGFDPSYGFFKSTSEQFLYPNPQAHRISPNYLKHFHFLGRMLGKTIYENMMVELPLAPFFLCKLLNRHSSDVDIHHLESLDPELYRNLLYLKNYEGNIDELALNFTVINDDYGEVQVDELKPGGREVPVTDANKVEYIHLMADYKLNRQIRGPCNAFRAGLSDVVDVEWLQMFDYREFQILISGAPVPVDLEDLRQNTNYSGGFSDDDPYINSLWEILHDLTDEQKRRFLKFVTSCSRPPLLGFSELYPKVCIHHGGVEDRLPSASTCMNMLKLPEYKDVETLRERLLYAIESGAGFELS